MAPAARRTWRDIPGWFPAVDHALFEAILEGQAAGAPGDLVEIGVFKGRSAVVIGAHVRDEERFVVVDPFGDRALLGIEEPGARRAERNYFTTLDRRTFEENYLSVHDELPVILQALSRDVVAHVAPGAVRFLHVDGSHEYDDVRVDAGSARTLLRPDGVVVFDDYRKFNAPGVGAAVWQAVATEGLVPVAITRQKLYGTYGDPAPLVGAVRTLAERDPRWVVHEHQWGDRTLLRVVAKGGRRATQGPAAGAGAPQPSTGPGARARRLAGRLLRRARRQS